MGSRDTRAAARVKTTYVAYCEPHDKMLFASRKAARRRSRRENLGLRPYPCAEHEGYWHLGHLPRDVVSGRVGREKLQPEVTR